MWFCCDVVLRVLLIFFCVVWRFFFSVVWRILDDNNNIQDKIIEITEKIFSSFAEFWVRGVMSQETGARHLTDFFLRRMADFFLRRMAYPYEM